MTLPLPRGTALASVALVGLLTVLAGCRDREVTTYRVAKETEAPAPDQAQAPAAMAPAPAADFSWKAPADWTPQAASGMRIASFSVAGSPGPADVSVVSFSGDGGDDLANVNRWRGQVGLAPIAQGDLAAAVTPVATPAGSLSFVDFSGTAEGKGPTRILGAWLRSGPKVWFFKMIGPAAVVGPQHDAFVAFLSSVSPTAASAPREAPGDTLHVQASQGVSLLWTAPEGWRSLKGNSIRRGSFDAGNGAEVAITAFPGDVGGTLANVNRWRDQAGLEPVDNDSLGRVTTALEANGLHITVFDGSDGKQPLVAAIVPWKNETWFFKLQGPAAAVAAAKPSFLAFLRTVRAP
jgi:hypothetical protein